MSPRGESVRMLPTLLEDGAMRRRSLQGWDGHHDIAGRAYEQSRGMLGELALLCRENLVPASPSIFPASPSIQRIFSSLSPGFVEAQSGTGTAESALRAIQVHQRIPSVAQVFARHKPGQTHRSAPTVIEAPTVLILARGGGRKQGNLQLENGTKKTRRVLARLPCR